MELQKALRKVHYVTLTKRRQVHYPGFKVAQHRQMNADERTQDAKAKGQFGNNSILLDRRQSMNSRGLIHTVQKHWMEKM